MEMSILCAGRHWFQKRAGIWKCVCGESRDQLGHPIEQVNG